MAKILCIESSTGVCSVALAENGNLLDLKEDQSGLNHSKLLTAFVQDILKENNLQVRDLAAVAVSEGPGSYTGLRIGVSAAKGICYAAGIPLIAISPLKAMAHQVAQDLAQENREPSLLVPMIDARRMEVYRNIYDLQLNELEKTDAVVIEPGTFDKYLSKQSVFFFGNGADKCKEVLQHPNAHFLANVITSAKNMLSLATGKLEKHDFVDVAYFEPFYLKNFIATKPRKNVLGGS